MRNDGITLDVGPGPSQRKCIEKALDWGFSVHDIDKALRGVGFSKRHMDNQLFELESILTSKEDIDSLILIGEMADNIIGTRLTKPFEIELERIHGKA